MRMKLTVAVATPLLALLVAAGISAAPGQASTGHTRIVWGVNRGTWEAFKGAIPAARGVRVYYDSTDPAKWPKTWPQGAKGAWDLLSMRPLPGPLLSGKYDAYFKALFASAPSHSMFTIWHENCGGNPLHYPPSVHNPATFVRMQKHMEALVQGTRVKFGTVIIAPVATVANWLAPHLDWYSYDFYAFPRYLNKDGTLSKQKIWTRMDANLTAIRKLSGHKYPLIVIAETNSSKDWQRKNWFTYIGQWFATHNGHRAAWVLTFWNGNRTPAQGGLSGPWPPSRPVIQRLRSLAATYR